MSQPPKEFEEIDKFLALARTVDNFKNCQTVYELFGITEPNAPYASIEASINDFVGNYQASAHVPKYKTFVVELQKNIDMIKRVLGDKVRDEYNKYLRDNDPKIAKLKGKFDFATDNGTLSSDDEDKLIEAGRNDGLDEDECVSFIDRWMKENGVSKVDSTSSSTSSSSFDKLLGLTFYEILGVPESANQAQIEEKYKEKYRENQKIRDKKRADGEWAIITAAYNHLRDPAERIKYDRELHNPPPPPPGTPVLKVVRDPKYVFKNVKKGTSESARIVIKNSGGGLLQGTITSDASWLEPDRNKLLDIHEQELYINIFTSKIPPRTYKVAGNVAIDTNAGKEIIPFEVFLESYDDELLRLKQYYVPMLAALGGLIFSFHYNMLGLVIAGISLWIIGAFAAKPLLDIILNQRINLGKIPTPAVRVVSIGIVVLAIWLQVSIPKHPPQATQIMATPVTPNNSQTTATSKTDVKPYLQGESGQMQERNYPYRLVINSAASDDRKAIANIYLQDPYEYECDMETVDKQINGYQGFIKRFPDSMFVPEALVNVAYLELYSLQCEISNKEKILRLEKAISCYKEIFTKHSDQSWGKTAKEICDVLSTETRNMERLVTKTGEMHNKIVKQMPLCTNPVPLSSQTPAPIKAAIPVQAPPSDAASSKMVEAPTTMVGDSYTYESENISNINLSYVATREVTAIDGNRLTLVSTNAKSGSKRYTYYDRVWGYLGSGSGNNDGVSFSPALKYLDFPLSVGKKWSAQSTETDKKTGHQRQHTIIGTVEGWEKVQVPAGEYEALKIVLKTEVKDADNVSPGTDVSWYVPALRRSVKSELTGLDVTTGREEKRTVRLLSYHVTSVPKTSSHNTANKIQTDISEPSRSPIGTARDALQQGMMLSETISKLPKQEKVLQGAKDLAIIDSIRYKSHVTIAENTLSAVRDRRDKYHIAYINKILELVRYTPEEVSNALTEIQGGDISPHDKIVVELLAEHVKFLRKNQKADPALFLANFSQRFSNYN